MMDPRPRAFMPGRKLFSVRNVASRLASTVARQPSSGMSSSGAGGVRLAPALATRMSTGPRVSSTWRRMASTSAKLVTSPVTPVAVPPLSWMAATPLATASPSRPCTATAAPARANWLAMAAPMPRELPVTRATWPFSVVIAIPVRCAERLLRLHLLKSSRKSR